MSLIPALATLLIFGIPPWGGWIATGLSSLLRLPLPVAWLVLFAASFGGLRWLLGLVAVGMADERPSCENDPLETGTPRGQLVFWGLLLATLGLLVPTALHGLGDAWRLGFCGLCLGAAFLGGTLGPVRWLPPTRRPGDPKDPATPRAETVEAEADVPAADRREHHLSWRFSPDGADGTAGAPTHSLSVVLRGSRIEAARTQARPEVAPGTGYGVLATYVRDGITPDVLRCAQGLKRLAEEQGLAYLDFVAFVLAFVRDAIPLVSDQEAHGAAQRTAYPLETLADRRGDGTDRTLLAAALLRAAGLPAHLAVAELSQGGYHLAVAVPALSSKPPGEGRWVEIRGLPHHWCEPGSAGPCHMGEVPQGVLNRSVRLVPVPLG